MKILLFGKDGQVGWELQRSLSSLGELIPVGSDDVDFRNDGGLRACLREHQPDIIVNAAAYTAVDKAESEVEEAHCINAEAVGVLAEEAARLGAWLVHYSTDYVFDGTKPAPYRESDPTNPLSAYGRSKRDGEQRIQKIHARHLIFRTSWVYAARGSNFAKTILRLAQERDEMDGINVVADQHGAPTSAELVADVTALVLHRMCFNSDHEHLAGTYHVAAGGSTTWHGYARYVLELAQQNGIALTLSADQIRPIASQDYPLPAVRPKNSRLDTSRLSTTFHLRLPDWQYHVRRLVDAMTRQGFK